jgi:4-amino-4-deoxychorismate lyase
MCRLLETIQLVDGQLQNAVYHNRRFNSSRRECFGIVDEADLIELIEIPEGFRKGIYRCRLLYDENSHIIQFIPYNYRQISSLKLVYDDVIDYHLKYADRTRLESLLGQRGDCDDIIIVKNGFLTDSSAANLVFFDGSGWYTPDTPLLRGTRRAALLDTGAIKESRITLENFRSFSNVGLINAFYGLGNMSVVPVQDIN